MNCPANRPRCELYQSIEYACKHGLCTFCGATIENETAPIYNYSEEDKAIMRKRRRKQFKFNRWNQKQMHSDADNAIVPIFNNEEEL